MGEHPVASDTLVEDALHVGRVLATVAPIFRIPEVLLVLIKVQAVERHDDFGPGDEPQAEVFYNGAINSVILERRRQIIRVCQSVRFVCLVGHTQVGLFLVSQWQPHLAQLNQPESVNEHFALRAGPGKVRKFGNPCGGERVGGGGVQSDTCGGDDDGGGGGDGDGDGDGDDDDDEDGDGDEDDEDEDESDEDDDDDDDDDDDNDDDDDGE